MNPPSRRSKNPRSRNLKSAKTPNRASRGGATAFGVPAVDTSSALASNNVVQNQPITARRGAYPWRTRTIDPFALI
jgi:hypothetical protein